MNQRQVPRTLRVLHTAAAREWRGGERELLMLATGLRARGAEPLVAARPGSPLLQMLTAEAIETASLAMRSDLDLLAVRRLRRLIATWRPDVVHASRGGTIGGAEGLGTAVIESMSLGVPTVAVAAGGLGEIIEDGRNGRGCVATRP